MQRQLMEARSTVEGRFDDTQMSVDTLDVRPDRFVCARVPLPQASDASSSGCSPDCGCNVVCECVYQCSILT